MSIESKLLSLVGKIATDINFIQSEIGVLDDLPTTVKTSLVESLIELRDIIDSNYDVLQGLISDTTTDTTHTWSSNKIAYEINLAITELIDGAPGALDTLKELAAALQDNPDIITNILTGLSKRVAVDQVQVFTAGEQLQARQNIGAVGVTHGHTKSQITDFVESDYVHISGTETISGAKTFTNTVTFTNNIDASINQFNDVVLVTPLSGQTLKFNGTNWVNVSPTFITLNDAPVSYAGSGGFFVKVKSAEDGLEFVDVIDGGTY